MLPPKSSALHHALAAKSWVCREVNRGKEIAENICIYCNCNSQKFCSLMKPVLLFALQTTHYVLLLGEVCNHQALLLSREVAEQAPFPGCQLLNFSTCTFFPYTQKWCFTACWIFKVLFYLEGSILSGEY